MTTLFRHGVASFVTEILGMGGREFCETLFSGWVASFVTDPFLRVGARGYVTEPFSGMGLRVL